MWPIDIAGRRTIMPIQHIPIVIQFHCLLLFMFVLTCMPKRSINKDSYPRSETRAACSYKSSYDVSPTPLPIRVISLPFPRPCFRKHFGHSSKYKDSFTDDKEVKPIGPT